MNHKYIDISKLKEFDNNIDIDDIVNDLRFKYKITNVADELYTPEGELCEEKDEEPWYVLAEELYNDIIEERANYKAYIEHNMDARMLMELRKSAILPMDKSLENFYGLHSTCETAKDVKQLRTKYFKFLNEDYIDADWQYYVIIKYFLRKKSVTVGINFESLFKDCDPRRVRTYEDIRNQFRMHLGVGPLAHNLPKEYSWKDENGNLKPETEFD